MIGYSSKTHQDSRPANRGKGIGKSKWAENVGGDEIEASGTTGLANGSLSVYPFLLANIDAGRR